MLCIPVYLTVPRTVLGPSNNRMLELERIFLLIERSTVINNHQILDERVRVDRRMDG